MNGGDAAQIRLLGLAGLPEVEEGADLAALLAEAAEGWGGLHEGDIVVISSKVVSKALGLWSTAADREAAVREESLRVVAERLSGDRLTQIVEAAAGPVMAAAGVDASNTGDRLAPGRPGWFTAAARG